jgi:hypothetical protein
MSTPTAHGLTTSDGTAALVVISEDPLRKGQIVHLLTEDVQRYKLAQIGEVLHSKAVGEGDDQQILSLATRYGIYGPKDHPRIMESQQGSVMSSAVSALRS